MFELLNSFDYDSIYACHHLPPVTDLPVKFYLEDDGRCVATDCDRGTAADAAGGIASYHCPLAAGEVPTSEAREKAENKEYHRERERETERERPAFISLLKSPYMRMQCCSICGVLYFNNGGVMCVILVLIHVVI